MKKQKLGISIDSYFSGLAPDFIKLVKKVGFDAVSPVWEEGENLPLTVSDARKEGLIIQSLHAPYNDSARMWSSDSAEYAPAVSLLLAALEDCRKFEIPCLVLHTWIGFGNIPAPTECGIEHFRTVVEKAAEYGIRVAFENTEGEDHLEALLNAFRSYDNVGFCYDSGHEMCYNRSSDMLKKYGDRLIMTHLNDNLGISRADGVTFWTDDLHLLPFDGSADWDGVVKRLKASRPQEILNLELSKRSKPNRHENDVYEQMSAEEYLTAAYNSALKIAEKYFN